MVKVRDMRRSIADNHNVHTEGKVDLLTNRALGGRTTSTTKNDATTTQLSGAL